ncbi:hypothetical protein L211DRAFT_851478 [Terfezia boudieri ATCC MYA-4762]|uniref:Uncharacterized protein n=1 Tax=Terfezia boudieri ATCC MYA-4762 TaxID=1051890 RepID=A0A3N4LF52_9PEZI|nr:hypothetical protein L211DRAFT_851478 [Terfezia boudieri ATCC MYA-4762]
MSRFLPIEGPIFSKKDEHNRQLGRIRPSHIAGDFFDKDNGYIYDEKWIKARTFKTIYMSIMFNAIKYLALNRGLIRYQKLDAYPKEQKNHKGTSPTAWLAILTGSGRSCDVEIGLALP